MSTPRLFDPNAMEAGLVALLAQHPNAPIGGLNAEGQLIPLPDSFPVGEHAIVSGRSPVDMVRPADRMAVIRAWDRIRTLGYAKTDLIHLATDSMRVVLHLVDVRETRGFYVMLFEVDDEQSHGDAERELLRHIPMAPPRLGTMRKNEVGNVLYSDDNLRRMLGWTAEEFASRSTYELVHPDHQVRAIDSFVAMLGVPGASTRWRGQFLRKDETWLWVEVTNTNLLDDPDHGYVLGEMVDITDEMAAQEALRGREQLMQRLAQAVPLGLFQFDGDRQVVYTNDRLHAIVGTAEVATVAEQLGSVIDEDRSVVDAAVDAVLGDGTDQDLEVRLQRSGSDDLRLCAMSLRALTNQAHEVTGAIACISDVTESARMREELRDRATFDALTGCMNRASVMTALQTQLSRPRSQNECVGVVFVDLDHFKPINDLLGHAAGDELLKIVADHLQGAVRGDDFVGRLGGDEFLIVCPRVSGPSETLKVAERMAALLHTQVEVAGSSVDLRGSLGVACAFQEPITADALVAEADAAMYESKRQGAGTPVMFAASLRKIPGSTVSEERLLRGALENGDLAVHYQPLLQLRSGRTVGYEGLVRWWREGELRVAGDFIEVAEQTGLIHELGPWVIDEVCKQAAQARATGGDALQWAINVSPLQVAAQGLATVVDDALRRTGTPPGAIVIEVTEHRSLGDSPVARDTLHELAEIGVSITLDDFGTGFSSLNLLRTLPVRGLKIDPSFTAAITEEVIARNIVESILDLGRRLGMTVVVEGIETEAQHLCLLALGAELGQGFLFSEARSAEDLFDNVIRRHA